MQIHRLLGLMLLIGGSTWAASKGAKKSAPCPSLGHPWNWAMEYCMALTGEPWVDAEVNDCGKKALGEIGASQSCALTLKYRRKYCELAVKSKEFKHQTVKSCMDDRSLMPTDSPP